MCEGYGVVGSGGVLRSSRKGVASAPRRRFGASVASLQPVAGVATSRPPDQQVSFAIQKQIEKKTNMSLAVKLKQFKIAKAKGEKIVKIDFRGEPLFNF